MNAGAQRPRPTPWRWRTEVTRSVVMGGNGERRGLTNLRQELRLRSEGFD